MAFFEDTVLPWLVLQEGGFSDDPSDPGNWTCGRVGEGELKGTKWGVSAKWYPNLDIKNLTMEQLAPIMKAKYWTPAGCDHMAPALALCVVDFAYNAGVSRSIKTLQRLLGLPMDGIAGPVTLKIVDEQDPGVMIQMFTTARIAEYAAMSGFEKFGTGWTRRAEDTEKKAFACLTGQ